MGPQKSHGSTGWPKLLREAFSSCLLAAQWAGLSVLLPEYFTLDNVWAETMPPYQMYRVIGESLNAQYLCL
jgi:hypothetical protein